MTVLLFLLGTLCVVAPVLWFGYRGEAPAQEPSERDDPATSAAVRDGAWLYIC